MDTEMGQNEVSGCLSARPVYEEQVQVVSLQFGKCQRHSFRSLLPTLTPPVLRIRDPVLFLTRIRDGKKSGSGSGMKNPDHISESNFFGLKYLNCLKRIPNIPDPQHWT